MSRKRGVLSLDEMGANSYSPSLNSTKFHSQEVIHNRLDREIEKLPACSQLFSNSAVFRIAYAVDCYGDLKNVSVQRDRTLERSHNSVIQIRISFV